MTFVVGIDTSTTATKAIVVDADGNVVGSGSVGYDYQSPHPLWAEQDPDVWVTATHDAVARALQDAEVAASDVVSIGLTGQMHGLVVLGADHRPLRAAILWNDQRTAAECDEMRSAIGRERMIDITGNEALPGFTASKVLWVRNHEPDVFRQTRTVLLPKDFVRLALTGDRATDVAGASGTQLFDVRARTWSQEVFSILGLEPSLFPPTHEGPEVTGSVSAAAAAATGLLEGTPIVAGGGDQSAAAVGVGAVAAGVCNLSLGTSGVVFAPTRRPEVEPQGRLHAFCHAVPRRWHLMGVMLSAAGSLQWFRDTLMPDRGFEEITALAGTAPPGSDGLLFLPYLTGERTPHPDPSARGAFVGLTTRHGTEHMARAVMEGVAFGLRDILGLIEASTQLAQLRVTGGGAASGLWRSIIASVLDTRLHPVAAREGAAYGAAILAAAQATGEEVEDIATAWVETEDPTGPVEGWSLAAEYERYRALYPALSPTFRSM